MGFVQKRTTKSKLEVPEGAFKEAQLLLTHDIVSKVDKYQIEDSLVINMGQILTRYVPVNRSTLVKKCDKTATIKGNSDKRSITATFAITFNGNFLPIQLIYTVEKQVNIYLG